VLFYNPGSHFKKTHSTILSRSQIQPAVATTVAIVKIRRK
jgi:hypothetical protein